MEEIENRYLTPWEKRMRKALEQKVLEDYAEYEEEWKNTRKYIVENIH